MKIWNLAYSVTNACNLHCSHCYANSGMALDNELSINEIGKFVSKEAVSANTRFITLTGGEPFMRSDILDIVSLIKSANIRVCIATNGVLIDNNIARQLRDLHVDRIQISLESADEHENDNIRGNGVYRRLTETVIPSLSEMGLFVALSITPVDNNFDKITQVAELCERLHIPSLSVRRFVNMGRATNHSMQIQTKQNLLFLQNLLSLREQYKDKLIITTGDPLFALVNPNRERLKDASIFSGCTAGIASIAIDPSGNIKPCTRTDVILGNIRQDSLRQIWNEDPTIKQLRNRNSLQGKCGLCPYKLLCGGCRAAAFVKTGNILGEDPECWI